MILATHQSLRTNVLSNLSTPRCHRVVIAKPRLTLLDGPRQRRTHAVVAVVVDAIPVFAELHSDAVLVVLTRLAARRSVFQLLAVVEPLVMHAVVGAVVIDVLDVRDQVLRRAGGGLSGSGRGSGGVDGGGAGCGCGFGSAG